MREALRPLQAAFINVLMKRLMSVSPEWGQAHPCWLIVDEVHSLNRLPALYETETEGRKYGLKLIQGTQGKTQYEEYYDRLSKAMLAAPKLKLFFRCGESESARWISDTIGEYEVEKPKIGTTASVEDRGRDALNYSTTTEHRQAISKEEIMALPDLHGYWKYGDAVVPFRLPLAPIKVVTRGFIPRELPARETNLKKPEAKPDNTSHALLETKQHEHVLAENETIVFSAALRESEANHEADASDLNPAELETRESSQSNSEEIEIETDEYGPQ
jgi:hypothetical protein